MTEVLQLHQQGAAGMPYHSDADGVVELVHEDADDGRGQQQQDQRVLELHTQEGQVRIG